KAWTPDQEKLVSRLKALVHRFEETRDLRLIGGYRQGSDPDLDMAVRQVPIIYDILKQTPGEKASADAFTDLATALKNGSASIPAKRG
ncbi:MAG: flagellum-specific ATP synthase FliI, partial [Rhizobiaceae bacterium]|nr:flagellum-specific ATP synthase FliI [Rhizobiaceae bacterium]